MFDSVISDMQARAYERQRALAVAKDVQQAAQSKLDKARQDVVRQERELREVLAFLQQTNPGGCRNGWFAEFGLEPLEPASAPQASSPELGQHGSAA